MVNLSHPGSIAWHARRAGSSAGGRIEVIVPREAENNRANTRRSVRPKRREWIGTALIALGLALLIAAAGQYGYMYTEQAALRRQWRADLQRQEMRQAARDLHGRMMEASARALRGPIRLLIPAIGVDNMVVRGTGYASLLAGPGWMVGTPPPGANGNMVIAGHRDTFFLRVHALVPGDMISLERAGRKFRYAVVGKQIIEPTDTAVLRSTPGSGPVLTLVTCYPTYWVGPAPRRMIVRAKLVGGAPLTAALSASAH
ncbi:MAG: class D sortase [Terriglobales bacterium]